MVYFECGKCNETVKKPKLAKHLQSCQAHHVSCIDCSKVFGWNEWESHTNCVSEAQKYQGNLYQPKESSNKGQLKQDAWVDNVRKAISGSTIPPQIRCLLEKLLGFDNIPRKQKAFGNFVKNSVKVWDDSKIEAMWQVISKANAKPADQNANGENHKPPEVKKAREFPGWKRAIDEELEGAGGALPWKKLCRQVKNRYCETNPGVADDIESRVLSAIPEEYCSDEHTLAGSNLPYHHLQKMFQENSRFCHFCPRLCTLSTGHISEMTKSTLEC
eukprot:s3665_g5.t4